MAYKYRPRAMPARYMEGAPAIARAQVLDLIKLVPAEPLDYDVVFRDNGPPRGGSAYGLDFGSYGAQGCHFYLTTPDMRAYRERNRRKRVAWRDLPAATQSAIIAYLES